MLREELKSVLETLSTEERDALESIIIHGMEAKTYGVDTKKLERLGLIYQRNDTLFKKAYKSGAFVYCGGKISEFFEVVASINSIN